ncbi:glycosyltransferase [Ruegeria litorea]|uniref:Glycosyltransferase n=1 Tax=Falsiruegeria litorea TaxID=1280831 RepID=A0ABS5WRJ8_9RHOB|nr:glycosyltransferase [Falsiruegeria litorea]MBT3141668.1 glycosyltransferase [Falsiruegeria litorea]
MKVMIAVTHLLGTGHLSRALTLGRAFAAKGHQVQILSGGMPVPQLDHSGVDLIPLSPLRSDGVNFTRLLTDDGDVASSDYLATRVEAAVIALNRFAPDVLITELFPFGRRVLRSEFLALLKAACALPVKPLIAASIRDILAPPSKPKKAEQTDTIIADHYDVVLVHSDPQTTRLEASWPVSNQLASKIQYTGYVAPHEAGPHPTGAGASEILVSAGGGSVGQSIFRTAIEAARKTTNRRWRLLVGGQDAPVLIPQLLQLAQGMPVEIESARPDFRQMLTHAEASVSMCGYNTTLDLLQAKTPAVIIPFDDGGEVEQTLRADSLTHLSGFEVVYSSNLSPDALLSALDKAIQAPRRDAATLNFAGAAQTVQIVQNLKEIAL